MTGKVIRRQKPPKQKKDRRPPVVFYHEGEDSRLHTVKRRGKWKQSYEDQLFQ